MVVLDVFFFETSLAFASPLCFLLVCLHGELERQRLQCLSYRSEQQDLSD
jgi:hypothetical protein